MNARLAVVAVVVWSQGLGWSTLGRPALAEDLPATTIPVIAVPSADEEIPEEILRTEIITEARSPLTGDPISAAEYAQLTDELRSPAGGNLVSQDIDYLVYLLQLRRALKPIIPFL